MVSSEVEQRARQTIDKSTSFVLDKNGLELLKNLFIDVDKMKIQPIESEIAKDVADWKDFGLEEKKLEEKSLSVRKQIIERETGVQIKLKLKKNQTIAFGTFGELENFIKNRNVDIEKLIVESKGVIFPRLEVQLGDLVIGNVSCQISAPYDYLLILERNVNEWLWSIRPWYSPVSKIGFFPCFLGLIFIFASLAIIQRWVGNIGLSKVLDFLDDKSKWIFVLLWAPAVIAAIWYITKKYLFPFSIFAIGKGERRYKYIVWTQKFIGGGIFLSVFVKQLISLIG